MSTLTYSAPLHFCTKQPTAQTRDRQTDRQTRRQTHTHAHTHTHTHTFFIDPEGNSDIYYLNTTYSKSKKENRNSPV